MASENLKNQSKRVRKIRGYIPLSILLILSLVLAACGDPTPVPANVSSGVENGSSADFSTEAACDGKGQVTGQILLLSDENKGLEPVAATITLTTAGQPPKTVKADSDGNYTVEGLDINEYEIEASLPEGFAGKTVQSKKKYITVDDCQIETASMALVVDGIKVPETPPAQPQQQIVYVNQQPHYSITNNPFFWLWLLDRPGYYGYSQAPYYTTRIYNQNNTIYVPQAPRYQPTGNYSYTSYKQGDTTATKVKSDPPVVSKGSTRIGSSGYTKPAVTAKGGSRPGSSGGSSSTTPKAGSGSSSVGSGSSSVGSGSKSAGSGSSSVGSGSKSSGSSSSSSKGSTRPKGKK